VHISRACREARRQRGLTQSEVADQVEGLSQPSLSRFESRRGALPDHVVDALAEFLDVDVAEVLRHMQRADAEREPRAFVCESPWCPSVQPVDVGGDVRFVPAVEQSARDSLFCRWCGHRMIASCSRCGAPVEPGIFCTGCGTPYVVLPMGSDGEEDPQTWSDAERQRRGEITGLAAASTPPRAR